MDAREDFNQQPTNITPQRKAVALKYEAERDMAPRVIAKGRGHVAEHILETAQKNAVPVYKDKTLVNMLMALEIDREIRGRHGRRPPATETWKFLLRAYAARVAQTFKTFTSSRPCEVPFSFCYFFFGHVNSQAKCNSVEK